MQDDEDDLDEGEDIPPFRTVVVPLTAAGLRLDRFLALRFKQQSRTGMARGIKEGRVTLADGRVLRSSTLVRGGEELQVALAEIAPSTAPPPFPPILYEDDQVVALNKPPAMMVHPSGSRWVWALIGLAKTRWAPLRVDLVHRLDKDTSGVLLLSKSLEANAWLKRCFREDRPKKEYHAIVKGLPRWDRLEIREPLGREGADIRIKMAVRSDGVHAHTDVDVLERNVAAGLTRVRCRIHTGRTHQIRVHLAHVGFPLLGDLLYGVPNTVFHRYLDEGASNEVIALTGAPRHALHAARLTFPHPDGRELTVEAPWPDDLRSWWEDPSQLPPRVLTFAPPTV